MSCHPSPRAPIEADLAHAHTVVDVVASGTIRWCVEDVSSQPIFRSNCALALLPEPFVAGQRWRIALRTYDAPAAPEGAPALPPPEPGVIAATAAMVSGDGAIVL